MTRRSLLFFIGLSLAIHFALASFWLIRWHRAPLAGGGVAGGNFVSIEVDPAPSPPGDTRRSSSSALASGGLAHSPSAAEERRILSAASAGSPGGLGAGSAGNDPLLAEIRLKIEQAKRYPAIAQRNGIEGVSVVRFKINPEGNVENLALDKSSGQSILDEEALETVKRAAPFPKYDEPLTVAIRFTQK